MDTFITSDRVQIYYTDQGHGPILLFAHGYGCTGKFFERNLPMLSKHFRVISVDLRGQGHSNQVEKGPRVSRLAQDLHELLRTLRLKDVTFVGWSMGCSVGWAYWDLFKDDRLSKFVFIDEPALAASTPDNPTGAMGYDELADFQQTMATNTKKTIEGFIKSLLHKTELNIDDLIADAQLGNGQFLAKLIFNHHIMDWSDVLPSITLPTLVLSGENSLVNWHSVQKVSQSIPQAKFKCFPDAGHLLFFEYPQKFNQLIAEFASN
jgi:pimeloyl-ACP methyl ester carboxylesterase